MLEVTIMIGLLLIGTSLAVSQAAGVVATGSQHGQSSPVTTFCHPGQSGVILCPCGNPPATPNQGCDNSSATGGAYLTWSGNASLSADTLVFDASFCKPHALGILLQGTAPISFGVIY